MLLATGRLAAFRSLGPSGRSQTTGTILVTHQRRVSCHYDRSPRERSRVTRHCGPQTGKCVWRTEKAGQVGVPCLTTYSPRYCLCYLEKTVPCLFRAYGIAEGETTRQGVRLAYTGIEMISCARAATSDQGGFPTPYRS